MPAVSQSNAMRVAAPPVSAMPLSPSDHVKDLRSLQDSIEAGSLHDLNNPDSECRMAIDVLVQLAATPGDGGKDARAALADVYAEQIGPEKRYALLNAAHQCTQQKVLGDTPELHAATLFMAACSPPPPLGNNGAGHIHARLAELARKVTLEFESNPKVLTNITQAELRELSARLENLNVKREPVSIRSNFAAVMKGVQNEKKTATVWVAGGDGQCVAVVAEPTADGKISFHVLAPRGDELGPLVSKALTELSSSDCVIGHEVEHPHLVLQDVNDRLRDGDALGHAIQNSVGSQSSMNVDDRDAANVGSRLSLISSLAATGAHSAVQVPASAGPSLPLPIGPVAVPPGSVGKTKSLDDLFYGLGVEKRPSGRLESAFDVLADTFPLSMKLKDPTLTEEQTARIALNTLYAGPVRSGVGIANFSKHAIAFASDFNAEKAPSLFAEARAGRLPLLNDFGTGENAVMSAINDQKRLVNECYAAKDPSALKTALDNIVKQQASLIEKTDKAIADLENPALTGQAKAEAKILIDALKEYRECLTGEKNNGGNVYSDLVAFAKQAVAVGPNLERAQALFQGREPRTAAIPAGALQSLPPNIFVQPPAGVDVPVTAPIASAIPRATRAELQTLASAGGFIKDKVTQQPTNVWFDISDTMNVHMKAVGIKGQNGDAAGYFERRRLSTDVQRRLSEMPESNKRLTTAVMKAGSVPLSLDKSPLWAHLDKARYVVSGADKLVFREAPDNSKEKGKQLDGQAQGLLSEKGQALVAISGQVLARLALLSTEITKSAALVTSKDPEDKNHRQFKESLRELQNWLEREGAKIETAINELDAVLAPKAEGVTSSMRADAKTLREGLLALQKEFKDPAGLVQQAIEFTRVSLVSNENLQQAADSLIV